MTVETIPILTKILREEAERVSMPEIREHAWEKFCVVLTEMEIADNVTKLKVI